MLHECKVYNRDGDLKNIITKEEITKKFQQKYGEGDSIYVLSDGIAKRICKHCGKKFETRDRRKKFCTNAGCARKYNSIIHARKKKMAPLPEKPCEWCEKPFQPRNSRSKYCKREGRGCAEKGRNRRMQQNDAESLKQREKRKKEIRKQEKQTLQASVASRN